MHTDTVTTTILIIRTTNVHRPVGSEEAKAWMRGACGVTVNNSGDCFRAHGCAELSKNTKQYTDTFVHP